MLFARTPGKTWVALLLALVVLVLLRADAARAGLDAQQGLSEEELQRLQAGELVERRITREQGELRLMGGTSWQVIDAPPHVVWQALLDTPYYPRMLPQLTEARVIQDDGRHRKLYMQHSGIIATSYYLDVQLDRDQRELSFRIDESRPHGIRAAWGFYAVRPYPGGKALLTYGVMADIGRGLGRAILRGTVHEWMMKVPWMVKNFVEGRGRELYSAAPADDASVVATR